MTVTLKETYSWLVWYIILRLSSRALEADNIIQFFIGYKYLKSLYKEKNVHTSNLNYKN